MGQREKLGKDKAVAMLESVNELFFSSAISDILYRVGIGAIV